MLWKKRLLSALLAVAVTAAVTVAVLHLSPKKPSYTPVLTEGGITLAAVGISPDEPVMRIGGSEAPAELLTYQIGYNCAYLQYLYDERGRGTFDPAGVMPDGQRAADYILSESLLMLKQQLVLENLAERCHVTLSKEQEDELAAQKKGFLDELGASGYRAELYKLGISEAGFDRLSRVDYLYAALYDAYSTPGSALYADAATLLSYAGENGYITADHILIPTVDLATREKLDEESIAANRALAEELLGRLRESDDPLTLFCELADEYSKDTGRAQNPDGYTFGPGTMVDEFDGAARALEEGEISNLVESQYGYHIILRKPLNEVKAAEAVRDEYFDVMFNAEVDRAQEQLTEAVERFDVPAVARAFAAARGQDET